mmetsp:Transcript_18589/g.26957  ORF Transcript_18589/g.26957 Transcript_18589/m.26957 type:complete len:91 (-) Transcript_18589:643-915(-)
MPGTHQQCQTRTRNVRNSPAMPDMHQGRQKCTSDGPAPPTHISCRCQASRVKETPENPGQRGVNISTTLSNTRSSETKRNHLHHEVYGQL